MSLAAATAGLALAAWALVALAAAGLVLLALTVARGRRVHVHVREERGFAAGDPAGGTVLYAGAAGVPGGLPAPERPALAWDDVAGLDDAKHELRELVALLRDPARFARLGATAPAGVLLHGPAGTGKTLLARATAAQAGLPVLAQPCAALGDPHAGAARVHALFAAARAAAPAAVLLDDLDALGAPAPGDQARPALDALLAELDALERGRVVVLATALADERLDPALTKAGRLDRRLFCPQPDLAGREAILRLHARGKPLAADADLAALARESAGLSGADLAGVANEAALLAGRLELERIRHVDLEAALERVVVGLPLRRRMTERERRILAYHEAGHALVAHELGVLPLQKVTIVGRGPALGAVVGLPGDDRHLRSRDELVDLVTVMLAGRAAEQVAFGRITDGGADDLERATALARAMVFEYGMGESAGSRTMRADNYALSEETKKLRDAAQARITDDAYGMALRVLIERRDILDRLAGELLRTETLDRHDLAALLTEAEESIERPLALGVVRALPRRD